MKEKKKEEKKNSAHAGCALEATEEEAAAPGSSAWTALGPATTGSHELANIEVERGAGGRATYDSALR